MKRILFLFLFACLSSALFADMTVVQKIHTGSIMGQPPKDSVMTMKVKGNKSRIEDSTSGTWMLVDLTANKMYTVQPAKKEVMSMSLDMASKAGDMFGQMSQNAKSSLTKGTETTVINGYKCEQYHLTTTGGMLNLEATYWVTSDVDSKEYAPFRKYSESVLKMLKMDDLSKLQGMPIRSETTMDMMGQKIDVTSEIQSITHDAIPDSSFVIPPDYKIQEMKMPEMPKQKQ
jgi:hypothetical protein